MARRLNESCDLECLVHAIFCERAESFGGKIDRHRLTKLWHVDALFLEIRLAAHSATWIKLRRARAIGVAPPHLGFLAGYVALSRHNGHILAQRLLFSNFANEPVSATL